MVLVGFERRPSVAQADFLQLARVAGFDVEGPLLIPGWVEMVGRIKETKEEGVLGQGNIERVELYRMVLRSPAAMPDSARLEHWWTSTVQVAAARL